MKTSRTLILLVLLCLYFGSIICIGEESEACVLIRDCRSAWSLSQEEIKQAICGYEDNRYAKIWCKIPCVTPDSDKGVCTVSHNCQPFKEYFEASDPDNPETRKYLRKFLCSSISTVRKHYVCCPNKPLKGPAGSPSTGVSPPSTPTNSLVQQCGIGGDEYKVVGGSIADLGEHPWAALLQYQRKGVTSFKCGGVLINRRYVLTAGHCINEREGKIVNVVLGEHNTSSPVDCYRSSCAPPPKAIPIERITQHPGWVDGRPQFFDDIALIRLAEEVDFSYFIKPICLPSPKTVPSYSMKLTVAGWGRADNAQSSEVKRVATLYRTDSTRCLNTISVPLRETQVCVGGGKVDTCRGDSGGPLMRSVQTSNGISIWYLVGIVSLGYDNPCGTPNKPGIYTSVSHYIDWIQQTMY